MELNKFMGLQLQLEGKNDIYRLRLLAKIGGGFKTFEEVDSLSQAELSEAYDKGVELIKYDIENRVDTFTLDGKTYRVKPFSEMTAEEWIALEETLEANENTIKAYPALLCILTGTKNPGAFANLEHTVAMPLLAFFLHVYLRLGESTQAYIKLCRMGKQVQDPALQASLKELTQVFTNC